MAGFIAQASSIYNFLSYIGSFLVIAFLSLYGFMNGQPLRSLAFTGLIALVSVATYILQQSIGKSRLLGENSVICNVFDNTFFPYRTPNFNVTVMAFAAFYVFVCAVFNTDLFPYLPLLSFLAVMLSFEVIKVLDNKCGDIKDVLFALIFGSALGVMSGGLLYNTDVAFFQAEDITPEKCKLYGKKFKCKLVPRSA
jgi:hypothetical protein